MAYRHFNGAPYLQCWSDGSHVCVQELDGRINKYPCALGVCIDPQITPFYGVDAVWCLRHAGLLSVGWVFCCTGLRRYAHCLCA